MASPITVHSFTTLLYYELIYEANKLIIENNETHQTIQEFKKSTSYILRSIIINFYRRLMTCSDPQINRRDADLLRDAISTLLMNVHTKYGTRPISNVLENPSQFM